MDAPAARRRRWRLVVLLASPTLVLAWLAVGYLAASHVCRPHPRAIPALDQVARRAAQEVSYTTEDEIDVSAWWVEGESATAVILLHGIMGDRRAGLRRKRIAHPPTFPPQRPGLPIR